MALSEKYFRDLARELGPEWESLASYLDFRQSEIYRLKMDNASVENQIFALLVAWSRRQRSLGVPAAEMLMKGLEKINRNDLAGQLEERLSTHMDVADAALHIGANFNPSEQPSNREQPLPQAQQSSSSQQRPKTRTTYTYEAPGGSMPYVGRLTITGENSPVIIGSVSNSTFNFGTGGGSSKR